ncbi:MAG: hypothetical protein RL637_724 [Pseudomonadota bacterium]|jgi:cell division transport system permease protein
MKSNKRLQQRLRFRRQTRSKALTATSVINPIHLKISVRLKAIAELHLQALFISLQRIFLTPFTSLMTIMVLAIAIASAGGFYLFLNNIEQLTKHFNTTNQISLFLKNQVTDQEAQLLVNRLQQMRDIQQVQLMTKDQALTEFKQASDFAAAIDSLDYNPLPAVIQLFPKTNDIQLLENLRSKLNQLSQVDVAQIDMQWLRRLQSIIELTRRCVNIINTLLSLAVLFIIGNTMRLSLENRREEVLVCKLLGATDAFIQRPFLYNGFWLGFCAGGLAWLMISITLLLVKSPIETLATLYQTNYQIIFLSFTESFLLLFISALLGVFGAWIVLYFQLKQIKPE